MMQRTIWQVWYADSKSTGLTTTTIGAQFLDHEAASVILLEQLEENGIEVEWLEVVRLYPIRLETPREALKHNLTMYLWESSPETIAAILGLLPDRILKEIARAADLILGKR